jgi:hypothetical protein
MTLSVVSLLCIDERNVWVLTGAMLLTADTRVFAHWCHVTNSRHTCIRITKPANVSSSTTNFTRISVESKPNFGAEKPASNHENHDRAKMELNYVQILDVFQDSTAEREVEIYKISLHERVW